MGGKYIITLERIEEEITEVIEKFAEVYEKRDLDAILSFIAPVVECGYIWFRSR